MGKTQFSLGNVIWWSILDILLSFVIFNRLLKYNPIFQLHETKIPLMSKAMVFSCENYWSKSPSGLNWTLFWRSSIWVLSESIRKKLNTRKRRKTKNTHKHKHKHKQTNKIKNTLVLCQANHRHPFPILR